MGSRLAALAAGMIPKIRPIPALNPKDKTIAHMGTLADGNPVTLLIKDPAPKPNIRPIRPPSKQRKTASIKNCNRISKRVAPKAF